MYFRYNENKDYFPSLLLMIVGFSGYVDVHVFPDSCFFLPAIDLFVCLRPKAQCRECQTGRLRENVYVQCSAFPLQFQFSLRAPAGDTVLISGAKRAQF